MNKQETILNASQSNSQAERFLGEQQMDGYTIFKDYVNGIGQHLRLYYRRFTPPKPKATLCIIHGFGEHSGRFSHVAEYFCSQGYEVQMIDLRGFGHSGGARGSAVVEQLLKDVGVLIKQSNQNLPLFLYGHSMGGLLVLTFTILNPMIHITGVVATSPLIGQPVDRNLTWLKLKILFTVSKDLEDLVMNSMVNPTALTKKNDELQHSFEDRLLLPFLGINMGASLLKATQSIKRNAHLFNKPLLILHGKQDSVTSYQDSIFFYDKCSSTEKSLKLFENGYHELQHDEEFDELKNVVNDWMTRRLSNSEVIGNLPPLIYTYPQKKAYPRNVKFIIYTIIFFIIMAIKSRNNPRYNLFKRLLQILMSKK